MLQNVINSFSEKSVAKRTRSVLYCTQRLIRDEKEGKECESN